jgi:aspartyl/asparaginyl beta-hydroxylase (cupin superfamily)
MRYNRNFLLFYSIQFNRWLYNLFIKTPAILNLKETFPIHEELEANWESIRDEVLDVMNANNLPNFHDIDKGQDFISNNDGKNWQLFVLQLYGNWIYPNTEHCPTVVKLLKNRPEVRTVLFSIIEPGKHIPEHRGPYKGIIRYQLALVVPKSKKCRIYIDGNPYNWVEGKSLIFDDTFPHELKNETNEYRVAMLLDIKRKNIPWILRPYDFIYYNICKLAIWLNNSEKKARINKDK